MEKICRYCTYYNNGACYNRDFVSTVYPDVTSHLECISESGHTAEMIRETINVKEITGHIVDTLIEEDFIKKAKIDKAIDYDFNYENLLVEKLDDVIYEVLIKAEESVGKEFKRSIEIGDPEFSCSYWF